MLLLVARARWRAMLIRSRGWRRMRDRMTNADLGIVLCNWHPGARWAGAAARRPGRGGGTGRGGVTWNHLTNVCQRSVRCLGGDTEGYVVADLLMGPERRNDEALQPTQPTQLAARAHERRVAGNAITRPPVPSRHPVSSEGVARRGQAAVPAEGPRALLRLDRRPRQLAAAPRQPGGRCTPSDSQQARRRATEFAWFQEP